MENNGTYDIHIRKTLTAKMTVLPSSGEVAFFCDPGKYRTIMVYRNGWHYKSIAPPCDHIQSVNILGVKIREKKGILSWFLRCMWNHQTIGL